MATFGTKIEAARKQRGWTQTELGDAIGAKQAQVSQWVRGKVVPELPNVLAIADRLGLSLNYLMDDSVDVDEKAMYTEQERLLVAYCRARKINPEMALATLAEAECQTKAGGQAKGPPPQITITDEVPDQPTPKLKPPGRRRGNSG